MKMPFMADDNVSGNVLGGETGASDVELYRTRDHRSDGERRAEEQRQRATAHRAKVVEDNTNTSRQ